MPADRSEKTLHQTKLPFASSEAASSSATTRQPTKKNEGGKGKKASERVFTDIILPILPKWIDPIAKREKNHEYRAYQVRSTVQRFWLYQTGNVKAITHVIDVSRPKTIGQVNDPSGIGNDDFDQGLKRSKYGYPIQGLRKLKKPISREAMKERFSLTVPQSYCFAVQALVDEERLEDMERIF